MTKFHLELQEGFSTKITSDHTSVTLMTDAPKEHGGKGIEFSPTDLLASALGSCILTIMGMYAKKMGIDLTGTKAVVNKDRGTTSGGVASLTVDIYCPKSFDAGIIEKLEKGAKNCPVHHVISPDVAQKIIFHWGQSA